MVELKMDKKEGTPIPKHRLSRSSRIFQSVPPTSFSFVHDGPSAGKNRELCHPASIFRFKEISVPLYISEKGDQMVIQEISFEHE